MSSRDVEMSITLESHLMDLEVDIMATYHPEWSENVEFWGVEEKLLFPAKVTDLRVFLGDLDITEHIPIGSKSFIIHSIKVEEADG